MSIYHWYQQWFETGMLLNVVSIYHWYQQWFELGYYWMLWAIYHWYQQWFELGCYWMLWAYIIGTNNDLNWDIIECCRPYIIGTNNDLNWDIIECCGLAVSWFITDNYLSITSNDIFSINESDVSTRVNFVGDERFYCFPKMLLYLHFQHFFSLFIKGSHSSFVACCS